MFCIDTITPNITLLQPPSDKLDISYATLGPLDDISLNNLVLFIPSSISHSPHNNPFDASNIHIWSSSLWCVVLLHCKTATHKCPNYHLLRTTAIVFWPSVSLGTPSVVVNKGSSSQRQLPWYPSIGVITIYPKWHSPLLYFNPSWTITLTPLILHYSATMSYASHHNSSCIPLEIIVFPYI